MRIRVQRQRNVRLSIRTIPQRVLPIVVDHAHSQEWVWMNNYPDCGQEDVCRLKTV